MAPAAPGRKPEALMTDYEREQLRKTGTTSPWAAEARQELEARRQREEAIERERERAAQAELRAQQRLEAARQRQYEREQQEMYEREMEAQRQEEYRQQQEDEYRRRREYEEYVRQEEFRKQQQDEFRKQEEYRRWEEQQRRQQEASWRRAEDLRRRQEAEARQEAPWGQYGQAQHYTSGQGSYPLPTFNIEAPPSAPPAAPAAPIQRRPVVEQAPPRDSAPLRAVPKSPSTTEMARVAKASSENLLAMVPGPSSETSFDNAFPVFPGVDKKREQQRRRAESRNSMQRPDSAASRRSWQAESFYSAGDNASGGRMALEDNEALDAPHAPFSVPERSASPVQLAGMTEQVQQLHLQSKSPPVSSLGTEESNYTSTPPSSAQAAAAPSVVLESKPNRSKASQLARHNTTKKSFAAYGGFTEDLDSYYDEIIKHYDEQYLSSSATAADSDPFPNRQRRSDGRQRLAATNEPVSPPSASAYGSMPPAPNQVARPGSVRPLRPFARPNAQTGTGSPGGYVVSPVQGGYGASPAQGGYGMAPAQGGYGAPPTQGGYGAPSGQNGYGRPMANQGPRPRPARPLNARPMQGRPVRPMQQRPFQNGQMASQYGRPPAAMNPNSARPALASPPTQMPPPSTGSRGMPAAYSGRPGLPAQGGYAGRPAAASSQGYVGRPAAATQGYPAQSRTPPAGEENQLSRQRSVESNASSSLSIIEEKDKQQPVTFAELSRLQKAADKKDPVVRLEYAKRLVEASHSLADRGGKVDAKKARKDRDRWLAEALHFCKKLCSGKEPYPPAMFYLAQCYGTGEMNLPVDHAKAFHLYAEAAKRKHAPSIYRSAVCYEIGAGTRADPERAFQNYKLAAQLGEKPAMYKLAMIKMNGLLGQSRDPQGGLHQLELAAAAADHENPHALHELGLLYESPERSRGVVSPNRARAIEYFQKAAKLQYAPSQYRLGFCYENGSLGCAVDPRRSIAWYARGAEQGHADCELGLSGWYLTGCDQLLEQSDTEAFLWAERAAEKGLAKAEYALGYFIESGIGVPRANLEEAKKWYVRAASQGNTRAKARLDELRKRR